MGARKQRIVIVEDHAMMREHLTRVINAEVDLEVSGEAETVQQALDVIRATSPQLALVDISLSEGNNGLDLIKSLKMISSPTLTLVLSMHDEALYAERALRAGARGYISKSRTSQDLMGAIRRVLSGEIYVSEKMVSMMLRTFTSSGTKSVPPIDRLTDRELAVLELIGQGKASRAISEALGLGVATVDTYRARIKEKLKLQNSFELQDYAIRWLRERG